MSSSVIAVDLGASSGRVMLGHVDHNELAIRPIARFRNRPLRRPDGLFWDVYGLYGEIIAGLRAALRDEPAAASIGIDSWAVDYGLIGSGSLLDLPRHYRDARHAVGVDLARNRVTRREEFETNGLQFLPFNTVYQLLAESLHEQYDQAEAMLLIPDLFNFWLTGEQVAEVTNASTTGLLNLGSRTWNDDFIARVGLRRNLLPPLVEAGHAIGGLAPDVASDLRPRRDLEVVAVASHDTASAIAATPLSDTSAYISCGTWALVGVELDSPLTSEAAMTANFTNEGGADGRVRFLRNEMGLWLLSESVRTWESETPIDLPVLLDEAARLPSAPALIDTNAPEFLPPGDMPARIAAYCASHGLEIPTTKAAMTRCIVSSLAVAYTNTLRAVADLTGTILTEVRLVGGGALNALLCQSVADHSGLRVLAGPVEATTIGNVLIQARASGAVSGSLESLRAISALAFPPTVYLPTTSSL